jgi:hypothetical protein
LADPGILLVSAAGTGSSGPDGRRVLAAEALVGRRCNPRPTT